MYLERKPGILVIYFCYLCNVIARIWFFLPPPHPNGWTVRVRFRDHTRYDTPHFVGLLWTSDQPVAETCTWQHTATTRGRHPCPRQNSNPLSKHASRRRPTPWTALPLVSKGYGTRNPEHKWLVLERCYVRNWWKELNFELDLLCTCAIERLPRIQNISRSVRCTEVCISSQRARLFGLRTLVGVKVFSFQRQSRLSLAPIQPPVQWVPWLFCPGVKRPGCGFGHLPSSVRAWHVKTFTFMWCTRVLYNMPGRPLKGSSTARNVSDKMTMTFRSQNRSTGNGRPQKRNSTIEYRSGNTQTSSFANVRRRPKIGLLLEERKMHWGKRPSFRRHASWKASK